MLRKSHTKLQTLAKQFCNFQPQYEKSKVKKDEPILAKVNLKHAGNDIKKEPAVNANFLTDTLGNSYRKWYIALEKHPQLKSLKRKDVENSAEKLKSLNYNLNDIISKPMILYYNSLTIENRYSVLRECGFDRISITLLSKYITVMNKTVVLLKSHGYIPFVIDIQEKLRSCFTDINLEIPATYNCDENSELKEVRQQILNCYLRQRLGMSTTEIEKLWKVYGRVRHKNFKSIQCMIQLLMNELQFPRERITKNAYLLYAEVDNVRRILKEIKTIDGQDVREIVYRRPKILMSPCDSLLKTLEHVKAFGIGEDAVLRCLEVLTLGPDTVFERLQELCDIEEFQVLGTNPRVLRLVHYQNKARLRLEYLNQLKVRCASLHILSCGSEAFAKFARDGSDRTKGRDIVVYLSNILKKGQNPIRILLSRHPNWCHIPATHVKQCYEFLTSKQFGADEIYRFIISSLIY